jgi:hypothetical protein
MHIAPTGFPERLNGCRFFPLTRPEVPIGWLARDIRIVSAFHTEFWNGEFWT